MPNVSPGIVHIRLIRSCLGILASGVACLLIANCAMPDLGVFQGDTSQAGAVARISAVTLVKSTPFRVRWLPAPDAIEGAVYKYRVYYRPVLGFPAPVGKWVLLKEVPASVDPGITVNVGDMPDGVYEIGVSAVGPGGESALHHSGDATASPSTGWYLHLR